MKIGSLFSGIGGLELGLEWAELGEAVWQVEIDEKLQNCLAAHWPNAKRYSDIRDVRGADLDPADLICGGFPCQDVSSAGKRAGLSGSRSGLWFEFRRLVEELRPEWVCVENVASGAKKWVDAVRQDLERLGYASLPIPISAADCGAWHRRSRIFIIAYRNGEFLRIERRGGAGSKGQSAVLAQGRTHEATTSDVDRERQRQQGRIEREERRWTCDGYQWTSEPDVARMVHGLPGRVDRERALGNSVVPQCAEVVGQVIQLLRELTAGGDDGE